VELGAGLAAALEVIGDAAGRFPEIETSPGCELSSPATA
jgi:hypothetical protein